MNFLRHICSFYPSTTCLLLVVPLHASEPVGVATQTLDEVIVRGRATDLVGTASASSDGSVGYVELNARPFLRRGELLEVIPGVVITQHSGGGKANQYFLRGFNLDHGTDFSISVDGMPVNMCTHAHGQGYADINFIIPEFVRGIDYNKGSFAAEVGDFSAAGAARFYLFNELPQAFARVEVGENRYGRFVAGDTWTKQTGAATTFGFEALHDDGPWELKENLRRFNGVGRHSWRNAAGSEFSVTALGYKSEWRSSDQIPLRAVEDGRLGRFGNVDSTDGGMTERASLSFDATLRDGSSTTQFNAYAIYYRLNLFSNFSYYLNDPVNGDQFNQRDRRGVFGASLDRTWTSSWGRGQMTNSVGLQLRDDIIGEVALRHTSRRELIGTVRDDEVRESSAGLYARNAVRWNAWLRTDAGLRGDFYRFDVDSDNPLNRDTRVAAIASPKLGLVLGPWKKTEFYLNAGYGFHSNDARGTAIRVDPESGEPVSRVDPLVRSRGFEAGVRSSLLPGLVSALSLWHLDLDSELVFVGDGGRTEPSGATRRYGVEWANYYKPNSWLTLDADVAFTHARYRDAGPDDRIANSLDTVVTAGVVVGRGEGLFGSLRLRYFGAQPLIEDNSVTQPSSTLMNARIGWRNRQWEVAVDLLNAFDRRNTDIAYFYPSRLRGEADEGFDDIHFHPAEPRTARVSVAYRF